MLLSAHDNLLVLIGKVSHFVGLWSAVWWTWIGTKPDCSDPIKTWLLGIDLLKTMNLELNPEARVHGSKPSRSNGLIHSDGCQPPNLYRVEP